MVFSKNKSDLNHWYVLKRQIMDIIKLILTTVIKVQWLQKIKEILRVQNKKLKNGFYAFKDFHMQLRAL